MKERFLRYFFARMFMIRASAFFLIIVFASQQSASFGQSTVLTRAQFSRFSVVERARFFEPTISRIAAEEAVDPYLLWTIAYNETRFRPWLRSYAGAEGLMQFIPATAARFNLYNPYLPEPAIRAAALYVRFLSNRFGGRIDSILAGYNAGEGAVDAYLTGKTIRAGKKIINPGGVRTIGGVPPYRETTGYVAHGLVIYRLLRARQVFSGAFVSVIYPPAVSASVARVWLQDKEIGFNGSLRTQIANLNFFNAVLPQQNEITANKSVVQKVPTGSSATSSETVSQDSTQDTKSEKTPAARTEEIYYETRTGARYKARNGKMERLSETGELIVGETVRTNEGTAIRARGTYFGKDKTTLK